MVLAAGSDFATIRLRQYPFPSKLQFCASGSASVADLITCCCPLPLADDDADFISSLFFGFGSSSIGVSLDSCDADAAASSEDAAGVPLLPLSFLWSSLSDSSANAWLITSLLRSSLSAPYGASVRTLQRSEWACACLLSLIALQPGHPTVAPNSSMRVFVILSLCIRARSNFDGGMVIGPTRTPGVFTVHLPSVILQGTPITLLMVSFSHLLRALHTPSAYPMKHSVLLFLVQSQIPNVYLGLSCSSESVEICPANTFSPNGTNSCDVFLPCCL